MERSDDVLIGGQNGSSININSNSIGNLQNGDINAVINGNNSQQNQVGSSNNNNNNNGNNNNINNNSNGVNERPANSYTMPGILHYLQHEWNRFEFDRQQWEVDRAELMTKISFLQGERRGQENLKTNLIRRIKMLELALKQERIKYHKLKYGVEPTSLSIVSTTGDSNKSLTQNENGNDITNDIENSNFSISQHPILNKENSNQANTSKQGRELLKQYLQEIGYTDTIVDVRSSRLRALLGLKSSQSGGNIGNGLGNDQYFDNFPASVTNLTNNNQLDPISNLINGNKQLLQLSNNANSNNANAKKSTTFTVTLSSSNSSPYTASDPSSSPSANLVNSNQINGSLSASVVEKILKLNETDAHSMLMDFMSSKDDSNTSTNDKKTNDIIIKNNIENNYINNNSVNEEEDDEMNSNSLKENNQDDQQITDMDTEDALKEFSFLSNESSSSMTNSGSNGTSDDWNVDKAQINKLTEQYKKDRKTAKQNQQQQQQQNLSAHAAVSSQRPNRATLQAMIANLTDTDSDSSKNQTENNLDSIAIGVGSSTNSNKMNNFGFATNPKMFLDDDNFTSDANLGDLCRISVNNSINSSGINDETVIDTNQRKTITSKFSLRGHFDAIRCLAFHPSESVLATGSEDQTIKLWNLDKSSLSNKKNVNSDIEPIYTFRKHTGPVLSLLISMNGDFCISSGLDSKIIIWNMPNYETSDQYDAFSPTVFNKYLNGHTDAVWSMALADNTLVSLSADATIRFWNPFSIDETNDSVSSVSCLNEDKSEGIPTSVDFINNDKNKIVTSFESTHHNLYDIETSKIISKFDYFDSTTNTHCYKVLCHSNNSNNINASSLILSAHEDKKIRFFDINSGKLVHQLVAHQDACTDLAIDPTNFYLLSASHDCSLRLWNLDNKNCIQEMTAHRKKHDESIHCIAFHQTKSYIASGGADAIVKIYV